MDWWWRSRMSRLTRSDIYKLPVNFNWGEGWQSWAAVTEGGLGEWQAFVTPRCLAMPTPCSPIHTSVSVPAGCCSTPLPTNAPKVSHVKPYAPFGTKWPISFLLFLWSSIDKNSSNMKFYLFNGLKVIKSFSNNVSKYEALWKSDINGFFPIHSILIYISPVYTPSGLLCINVQKYTACNIQLFLIVCVHIFTIFYLPQSCYWFLEVCTTAWLW